MKVLCAIGKRNQVVAFTRLELVIILLVVTVLVLVTLPVLAKSRVKAKFTRCAANLTQIGAAMQDWANEHTNTVNSGDMYPTMVPTNFGGSLEFVRAGQAFRHFQAASNEIRTTALLVCPSDSRRPSGDWRTLANSNLSYFFSVEAFVSEDSMMFLAGDRHLEDDSPKSGGMLVVTTNSSLRWGKELHSGRGGNAVLADGSVQQSISSLAYFIPTPLTNAFVNRLEFP